MVMISHQPFLLAFKLPFIFHSLWCQLWWPKMESGWSQDLFSRCASPVVMVLFGNSHMIKVSSNGSIIMAEKAPQWDKSGIFHFYYHFFFLLDFCFLDKFFIGFNFSMSNVTELNSIRMVLFIVYCLVEKLY